MTPKEYDALVRQLSPRSPIGKDTALAFVIGGAFCVIAQILIDKTKLTPARILVAYVVAGVLLGAQLLP